MGKCAVVVPEVLVVDLSICISLTTHSSINRMGLGRVVLYSATLHSLDLVPFRCLSCRECGTERIVNGRNRSEPRQIERMRDGLQFLPAWSP